MEFVADLTGGFGLNPKGIIPTEESKFEENITENDVVFLR